MDNTLDEFRNNLQLYTDACADGGKTKYQAVTLFNDMAQYRVAASLLAAHARLSATKTFGEDKRDGSKSMWMAANLQKIRIEYRPQPRPQNVRESSKEAYRVLDTANLQRKVLECVIEASRNGGDITRAEIAFALDMEKSTLSPRVNELLAISNEKVIDLDGAKYRLIETAPRHSRCPGAAVSKVAALRAVAHEGVNPAAPAAQTQTQLF